MTTSVDKKDQQQQAQQQQMSNSSDRLPYHVSFHDDQQQQQQQQSNGIILDDLSSVSRRGSSNEKCGFSLSRSLVLFRSPVSSERDSEREHVDKFPMTTDKMIIRMRD